MLIVDTVYEITRQKIYNEYIGWYVAYGFCDREKTVIITDVTTNLKKAKQILEILNTNKVSKIHLEEVIIDLLE